MHAWIRLMNGRGDGLVATKLADVTFRLVIVPSVNLHVLSALWILRAGQKYEQILDSRVSFGNRLRRRQSEEEQFYGERRLNLDCVGLFAPYFSAYAEWRSNGLRAIRDSLEKGWDIHAITMDVQQFYHRTSPLFLLRADFLSKSGLTLSDDEMTLTSLLLRAITTWYRSTPDYEGRPEGALPVGLSASKIIANVLLAEFDREVVSQLHPIYYGRYVDDVFLVLRAGIGVKSGADLARHLAGRLRKVLKVRKAEDSSLLGLQVKGSYAKDSEIIFAGSKQKVFHLVGKHGLDLIGHVEAHIQRQSSEHRLISVLPSSSEEMAARTLLAQASASLEPDALRKADVVSVRRLGLSILLRDVESYARDLKPTDWIQLRQEFYGLVHRHLITPMGVFDFYSHIHRVFGLMIACGDSQDARNFLLKVQEVTGLLATTSTARTSAAVQFASFTQHFARSLYQVGLQATSVRGFRWTAGVLDVFQTLSSMDAGFRPDIQKGHLKRLSIRLLYADWGRRPYRELWLGRVPSVRRPPTIPTSQAVRRRLRLGAIRRFRKAAGLRMPYWPALAFATRPISLTEISLAAPAFLQSPTFLRDALFAFRGARAEEKDGVFSLIGVSPGQPSEMHVEGRKKSVYRFAIPSFLTTDEEWKAAANGRPSLDLARYTKLKELINDVLSKARGLDFVLFPECSMPRPWVFSIAYSLARRGISLIAGLEYKLTEAGVRNDALLSLATRWPWHRTSVLITQPKLAPAHREAKELRNLGRKRLFVPRAPDNMPRVYAYGGITFATVICSDLTNISHRSILQGKVDALVVLEWNKDLDTFGSLVETTATDLHAYVIQSNNRLYGDSRVRAPRRERFERDSVRVRGGVRDYFVLADLEIDALRRFQQFTPKALEGDFKPVPIGFVMSPLRKGIAT